MRAKWGVEPDFDDWLKERLQIQKLQKEKIEETKRDEKKDYRKKRIWMGEKGTAEKTEKGHWGKPRR